MEISQSIYQSVFTRVYETVIFIGFGLISTTIYSIYTQSFYFGDLLSFVYISMFVALLVCSMLYLIVPWPHYNICFYDDRIEFFMLGNKQVAYWDQVLGYKTKNKIFPEFVIELEGKRDIKFGYYTFSKEQRLSIKEMLDKHRK